MPLNARDLWLFLRAQNLADRALNAFKKDVRDAGKAVSMAQLEGDRAAAQAELTQRKLNEALTQAEIKQLNHQKAIKQAALASHNLTMELQRNEIALLNNEKAALRTALALEKLEDADEDYMRSLKLAIISIDEDVQAKRNNLLTTERLTKGIQDNINATNESINVKRKDIIASEEHSLALRRNIAVLTDQITSIKMVAKKLKEDKQLEQVAADKGHLIWSSMLTPNKRVLQALVTGVPAVLSSPLGMSALILGALWVVSFVGAILGSGALALIAGGIVGLGVVALRENEKIKQAFTATGKFIKETLAAIAAPMIQPIIGALEVVRMVAKERIFPELAKILYGTRTLIITLVAMVSGAIAEFLQPLAKPAALEGLRGFVLNVQPHVLRLGKIVGEFFALLMRHGPMIAQAFGVVVSIIETFVRILGGAILLTSGMLIAWGNLWNGVWGGIKSVISGLIDGFLNLNIAGIVLNKMLGGSTEKLIKAKGATQELPPELQDLLAKVQGVSTGLTGLNSTATQTALKFDEVSTKAQSLFNKFMSVDQATANATTTIQGLKEALDVNGLSLDANTLAGAKNRTAILNAVSAAEQQRQKMIESGASTSYANKVYQENINKIYGMAHAFGVDQGALERFLRKYYDLANAPNIHKQIIVTGEKVGDDVVFRMVGSSLKFYAKGGRIAAKQAAIVGEQGPELFIPDKAGMILSHQKWMQNSKLMNKWLNNPGIATPRNTFPWMTAQDNQQPMMSSRPITINQYITTQEIDPRVHAAQLGWELSGRLV